MKVGSSPTRSPTLSHEPARDRGAILVLKILVMRVAGEMEGGAMAEEEEDMTVESEGRKVKR